MDFTSSLRRKQTAVTYSRRNRQHGTGSATSSPAAIRPRPAADASNGSSDEAEEPRENGTSCKRAVVSPIKSSRIDPSSSSSSASSSSLRHPPNPPHGSAASPSKSTPGGLGPKSRPTPSSTAPRSTSSLPQRPARAASPSTAVKARRPSASSTLPAKRSASTSPRKSSASSPSKRFARSRTPTRPAKDLSSLFDAIEPTLPRPRSNPFARSESHPVVHLAPFEALDPASPIDSPLQSPTLPHFDFDDQLSPGTAPISPSKRSRMADRMAPRTARPAKSKLDDIVESLSNSRRGSLRRTETAPSAIFDAQSFDPAASDATGQADTHMATTRPSEAASSTARLDLDSAAESQSQDTSASASGARRLAGIKQTSATNAKRTYGLQRSFLADQAEENLLTDSIQPPTPNPIPDTASRNIEDEIEAQINGHASTPSIEPARVASSAASRLSEPNTPAPRESYAELLKKWGEGADDIEWDESQDPTLNLKSITSLRSTGELRRFNDDLEYLFSGLDPAQNLSIRKSSAVELIRLLCGKPDIGSLPDADDDDSDVDEESIEDPLASAQSAEFLRKLKASDLIWCLFDLLIGAEAGEGTDDVLDASLAVYAAKLLKTASYVEPLMRERSAQLHRTLANMLLRAGRASRSDRKDGFALLRLHELKQHKIASRSDRKALDELRAISRISKLFVAGGTSWTVRNLVIAACCSLIALPRRLWTEDTLNGLFAAEEGVESVAPSSLFHSVLETLVSEGNKAQQRLVDFAKGLELVAPTAVEAIPDLETVDVAIRFLDKAMDMLYLELDRNLPASDETLGALQHLVAFAIEAAPLDTLSNTGKAVDRGAGSGYVRSIETRALRVLHVLFKMLLDLSQVDANWSESLASSAILQASIVRAFLLGHQSASRLRGSDKDSDDDSKRSPDVALFDDVVHLSLALLTNLLIKQLDKARDALEAVRLVPTCWRRRSCAAADACSCEGRLPALQLLARVFFETRIAAASRDDSNAAYLSNSIATAIAQFGVGGAERLEACRTALAAELPSAHSTPSGVAAIGEDGLQTLLDAVDEFAVVHQAALDAGRVRGDEEAAGSEDGEDGAGTDEAAQVAGQEGANPVAAEAGQLIKELAQTLRHMC